MLPSQFSFRSRFSYLILAFIFLFCNNLNSNNANLADTAAFSLYEGCTDPAACNYDPNATVDDGSCLVDNTSCEDNDCNTKDTLWLPFCVCLNLAYPDDYCDDGIASNGVEYWDETICDCNVATPIFGCTDPNSCNYNPDATTDDGSCEPSCDDNDCNTQDAWVPDLCICINIPYSDADCDDGIASNGVEYWDETICDCNVATPIFGCTDPNSCNYNPDATTDDGSCIFEINCNDGDCTNGVETWNSTTCNCDVTNVIFGCTNPDACNFNPEATCEDGSCNINFEITNQIGCYNSITDEILVQIDLQGDDSIIGYTWQNGTGNTGTVSANNGNATINSIRPYPFLPTLSSFQIQAFTATCNSPSLATGVEIDWFNLPTFEVEGCDKGDGTFDLTVYHDEYPINLLGNLNIWFEGPNGTNPIENPANWPYAGNTLFLYYADLECGPYNVEMPFNITSVPSANVITIDACADQSGTIDLTIFENQINNNTDHSIIWYEDAAATEIITTPENWNYTGNEIFVRIDNNGCLSNIESIPLFITTTNTICNDDICQNGEETWNHLTCQCENGTPPTPCIDDEVCGNGDEIWNSETCTCDRINIPDTSDCANDGNCSNGIEIWDTETCTCEIQEVVVGCTDPSALNYNPAADCDDGTCQCASYGCTNPNACNYNPDATCSDGSCQLLNFSNYYYTDFCDDYVSIQLFGDSEIESYSWMNFYTGESGTVTANNGNAYFGIYSFGDNYFEIEITAYSADCSSSTETMSIFIDQQYIPVESLDFFEVSQSSNCLGDGPIIVTVDASYQGQELNYSWYYYNTPNSSYSLGDTGPELEYNPTFGNVPLIINYSFGSCSGSTLYETNILSGSSCINDGDCSNGIETWDLATCNCSVIESISGCTNPSFSNYNPQATCDDGSCNCPVSLDMTGIIPTNLYEASDHIISDGKVISTSNGSVIFHAGNHIDLNPGFEADATYQFTAEIYNCLNNLRPQENQKK